MLTKNDVINGNLMSEETVSLSMVTKINIYQAI